MTTWYNAPTEKFAAAKIGSLIDGKDTNSTISFTEGVFKKDASGKTIDCFLWCSEVTDCKKAGESNWTFKPELIYFALHFEAYEKWAKDNKKETAEPNDYTKFLFTHISQLMGDESVIQLKGRITFSEPSNSITSKQLLSGVRNDGKPLGEDTKEFLVAQLFNLEVCETLENIKIDSLPSTGTNGYKGYGGSKGETTSERLQATKTFLIAEFGEAISIHPIKNLSEFAVATSLLKVTDEPLYTEIHSLISALLKN